ncbi:hypothetical protein HBI56_060500 [Parastagonospora nodorum]|nr:hypothetical protein HBH56_158120 [Parastagonospora nodorum]KAH3922941.1 hypothetical protein HBH54_216620 [Parastagonospora nodorum]KAH3946959.1 hypothetical protein HBH53_123810 [Parastagonospora nodorum]KAH3969701.1 hypothetical protein HBH52_171820 [Parastagonospora nodorum]KAH3973410.1 hypothetical protein HBH51_096990 [Parastagonospora nodorum]
MIRLRAAAASARFGGSAISSVCCAASVAQRSDLATRPQRRPNQRRPRNQKQRGKDNCKELPSGRKSAVLPNTTTFMDSDKTVQ